MKRSITFPCILRFSDYHEIGFLADSLNALGVDDIRVYEMGFDGKYVGLFYVGNRKDALQSLVAQMAKDAIDEFDRERESDRAKLITVPHYFPNFPT